jgi:hypothetical protein
MLCLLWCLASDENTSKSVLLFHLEHPSHDRQQKIASSLIVPRSGSTQTVCMSRNLIREHENMLHKSWRYQNRIAFNSFIKRAYCMYVWTHPQRNKNSFYIDRFRIIRSRCGNTNHDFVFLQPPVFHLIIPILPTLNRHTINSIITSKVV